MIIKIEKNIKTFINKCINNNINIINVEYIDNYALITISNKDYKRIKKISYYNKIKVIRNTGIRRLKDIFKMYWFDFLMILLFITIIFLESNVIVSVEIKHENRELKAKIEEIIKDKGIKPFILAKPLKELNSISDSILQENRNILDFISINREGMKLIVSIEERIIKIPEKEDNYCHIISNKDAIIKSITTYKGISLVEKNQSVKKGDILISGDLILNEEVKNQVCADGIIIGTTWYKINITYPKKESIEEFTKKHQYNLSVNNRLLLKNKYDHYKIDTKFKFLNIKFINIREKKIKEVKYSYDELVNKAINKAKDELKREKNNKIKIIDEKVLKVEEFNSKIELELFVSVEETIGTKKVGELIDTKQSIRYTN